MVQPGFKINVLLFATATFTEFLRWCGVTELRAEDVYGHRPLINEIISHFSQEDHDWFVERINKTCILGEST